LFWWHLQRQAWGARVDFGRSLVSLLVHPWAAGYQGRGWIELLGTAAALAALVALWRARMPLLVSVYCWGSLALMLVSNNLGFKVRFLSWAFPALVAVASLTRRRGWQAVAIAFAFLLPIVFVAYTTIGDYMVQP